MAAGAVCQTSRNRGLAVLVRSYRSVFEMRTLQPNREQAHSFRLGGIGVCDTFEWRCVRQVAIAASRCSCAPTGWVGTE